MFYPDEPLEGSSHLVVKKPTVRKSPEWGDQLGDFCTWDDPPGR